MKKAEKSNPSKKLSPGL